MILDTSALIAVLFREPCASDIISAVGAAPLVGVGAPTLVEAGAVLGRRLGFDRIHLLHRLIQAMQAEVIPFGEEHWTEAVDAYQRFGKGLHPASLNFGDCLAYATARLAGRPLLCVGDDFPKTDLELVPLG